jgi:general secretion pathway protein A
MNTTPAYVSAFALKAEPFSKEIDDAELWLPSSKQDLVD